MDLIFQGHEYLFALLDVDGSRGKLVPKLLTAV